MARSKNTHPTSSTGIPWASLISQVKFASTNPDDLDIAMPQQMRDQMQGQLAAFCRLKHAQEICAVLLVWSRAARVRFPRDPLSIVVAFTHIARDSDTPLVYLRWFMNSLRELQTKERQINQSRLFAEVQTNFSKFNLFGVKFEFDSDRFFGSSLHLHSNGRYQFRKRMCVKPDTDPVLDLLGLDDAECKTKVTCHCGVWDYNSDARAISLDGVGYEGWTLDGTVEWQLDNESHNGAAAVRTDNAFSIQDLFGQIKCEVFVGGRARAEITVYGHY